LNPQDFFIIIFFFFFLFVLVLFLLKGERTGQQTDRPFSPHFLTDSVFVV
jgi:hypothetical protein